MAKKKTQKKGILTEEILRLRLIPIEQYSSITVGAAELLAIKGAHKFDNYDDYDESSLDWLKDLPDDAAGQRPRRSLRITEAKWRRVFRRIPTSA